MLCWGLLLEVQKIWKIVKLNVLVLNMIVHLEFASLLILPGGTCQIRQATVELMVTGA